MDLIGNAINQEHIILLNEDGNKNDRSPGFQKKNS
jgi:hypothetical protein